MEQNLKLGERYRLLDAIGINYWLPKQTSSFLRSENPIFCATCLVLLPQKLSKDSEQYKILTGMLKVLSINAETLCVAWVNEELKPEQFPHLKLSLVEWAPYKVLIMGEALSQGLLESNKAIDELRIKDHKFQEINLQVTYHPDELQKAPEHKAKAYKDLLRLKEELLMVSKPWLI
jgi:hypothetical protein